MPFQNNQGNTSAKTAWGQWASFSLGLGKLKGYQGSAPMLSLQNLRTPKNQSDWMKFAAGVASGLNRVAETHEKKAASDVERFIKQHSVEELGIMMKERQIPFQDDPWAMSQFNKSFGELHAGVAESLFQRNLDNGVYDSLNPEQLDTEHYKHREFYLEDLKNRYGAEFFADGDPKTSHFREGFFSLAPKQRLLSIARQQERKNQAFIDQHNILTRGEINAYLQDPRSNAEGVIELFKKNYNEGGYHNTTQGNFKLITNIVEDLANFGDRGLKILDEIVDTKFDGSEYTVKEILSEDKINTIRVNARNNEYSSDMVKRSLFEREVMRLALTGGGIEKKQLESWLAEENKLSHGKQTWKGKYLMDALNMWDKANDKNNADAKQQYKRVYQFDNLGKWWKDLLEGKPVEAYKPYLKRIDLPEEETEAFWANIIQGTVASGDPNAVGAMINVASLNSAPPKLAKGISQYYGRLYNTEIQESVDTYRNGGGLPLATDPATGQELPVYQYTPIGAGIPIDVPSVPKSVRTLMDAYRANPSAMKRMFLKGGNKELYNNCTLMDSAIRQGINPIKYLAMIQEADSKMTREDKAELKSRSIRDVDDFFKTGTFGSISDAGAGTYVSMGDSVFQAKVKYRTSEIYEANKGLKDTTKCYEDAEREVASQHIRLGNLLIPKNDISQGFLSLGKVMGIHTDIDKELNNRLPILNRILNETLLAKGFKNEKQYSRSYYDEASGKIVILDDAGFHRGNILLMDVADKADKEFNLEMKKELIRPNKVELGIDISDLDKEEDTKNGTGAIRGITRRFPSGIEQGKK